MATTTVPYIPDSAPFTADQRAWLNGFVAGLISKREVDGDAFPEETEPLLVLFGSQSGNAESLAKQVNKQAKTRGFESRVSSMDEVEMAALRKEKNVLLITSTWGEGEMPDNAAPFWDALNQNGSSPLLKGINFSVLALGDRNYADTFCLAGKLLDDRFEELGATRIHPRIDCDVDFDAPAEQWSKGVLDALSMDAEGGTTGPETATEIRALEAQEGYSKNNPFPATLLVNQKLSAEASAKDTRHFALSLEGSDLSYEAGDALGVYSRNCPDVVDAVIDRLSLNASASVPTPNGDRVDLSEALTRYFDIRHLIEGEITKPKSEDAFIEGLRKMQPRLYSIASSPKAHPGEVHLCVDIVRYEQGGVAHKGVASTFLAERLPIGKTTGVFVHRSKGFRPPADKCLPMIMVGPGTGIAPFRAFLEEREATEADGDNWLFFGSQHRATDFFYEEQITDWQKSGLLTRLDLAFSRDQEEKIYVQHLIERNASELWAWLERGAHFYVCGDASRMAKDVDQALHRIVVSAGRLSSDDAAHYVSQLKKEKRYCRDVY